MTVETRGLTSTGVADDTPCVDTSAMDDEHMKIFKARAVVPAELRITHRILNRLIAVTEPDGSMSIAALGQAIGAIIEGISNLEQLVRTGVDRTLEDAGPDPDAASYEQPRA